MTTHSDTLFVFTPSSIDYVKTKAKHLRALVRDFCGLQWSLALAQKTTASALGYHDWHEVDTALKRDAPASRLNADCADDERNARWRVQSDALLHHAVPIDAIPGLLEEWNLTGKASPATSATSEQVSAALEAAWPQDTSELERAVRMAIREVVIAALPDLHRQGSIPDLRIVTLSAAIDVEYSESASAALAANQAQVATTTIRRALPERFFDSHHAPIFNILSSASAFLLGREANYHPGPVHDALRELLTDRLMRGAMPMHGGTTLWHLFFNQPDQDGLIGFRNNRRDFDLSQIAEDEGADELDEDEADAPVRAPDFPAHLLGVTAAPGSDGLTVSLLQKPCNNEYADEFRLTKINALLRDRAGNNVGFIVATLIESRRRRCSVEAFWNVCDSESQELEELAESIAADVAGFVDVFRTGALLHVWDCELAVRYRGHGHAATLVEAVVRHAAGLAGKVSGLSIDVTPAQFPWTSYKDVPASIRQELAAANGKLLDHTAHLLRGRALRGIKHRMMRQVYPQPGMTQIVD